MIGCFCMVSVTRTQCISDSDSDSDSLFNINMYILCEKKQNNNSDNCLVYTRICPGDRAKVM